MSETTQQSPEELGWPKASAAITPPIGPEPRVTLLEGPAAPAPPLDGPFSAGPRCPSCGERKLMLRPYVEPTAVCLGCGVQIPNVSAEQEQRLREAVEQRQAQAAQIRHSRLPPGYR